MDKHEKDYWFPAKKFGYGWGRPNCWQGWLLLAAFVALIIAGRYLLTGQNVAIVMAFYLVLTVIFLIIVYFKGEKRNPMSDD